MITEKVSRLAQEPAVRRDDRVSFRERTNASAATQAVSRLTPLRSFPNLIRSGL